MYVATAHDYWGQSVEQLQRAWRPMHAQCARAANKAYMDRKRQAYPHEDWRGQQRCPSCYRRMDDVSPEVLPALHIRDRVQALLTFLPKEPSPGRADAINTLILACQEAERYLDARIQTLWRQGGDDPADEERS